MAERRTNEWRGAGAKTLPRAGLRLLERVIGPLPQVSRYTIVSALALGLDVSIYIALTRSGSTSAAVAGILGYATGLVLHYALSSRFVFDAGSSGKSGMRLFLEFAASGLLGVFLTWAVIGFVVDSLGLWPVVGKAFAVVASFAAVYVLRRSYVFSAASTSAA